MWNRWTLFTAFCLTLFTTCKTTSTNNTKVSEHLTDSFLQPNSFNFLPRVLKIGAFNIQTFGRSKMSDPFVASIIRDIVKRYDVLLIQEIRDISGEALQDLLDLIGRTQYSMIYSGRLGRSSYKEQYAYFYKISTVQVVDSHQYDDGPSDPYEREPFSVRMKPVGGSWDFALSGLHAKPADAVNEINELINVYDDLRRHWSDVQDVILMGDFNAACSYAKESDLLSLPIYTGDFYWPLGFDVDTTTSENTDCAYDRFVVIGPNIRQALIPGSESIYRYELDHGLSYSQIIEHGNLDLCLIDTEDVEKHLHAYVVAVPMRDVSDHYPIELELY